MEDKDIMNKSISINCDGITVFASALGEVEEQLRSILELFRPFAAEFRDGFRLQIGWGPFIMRLDSPISYTLLAPDYANDAEYRVVDDLSLALWILVSQTAVVTASKIDDPCPLGFLDSVVLNKEALESKKLILSRTPPFEGDSGWFIDSYPQSEGELTAGRLVKYKAFQVLQINRNAVAAMMLPTGVWAVVDEETIEAVIRQADREILSQTPLPTR